MDKYQNKYRIASARLQNWDYASSASYFVTICTQNREYYFGDIIDGIMQLSEIGEIVEKEWLKTFEMRADMNLKMGKYVVMPNHFHAIIIIGKNKYNSQDYMADTGNDIVETQCIASLQYPVQYPIQYPVPHPPPHTTPTTQTKYKNQFGPQSKNLSSIIRGFKIGVTKNARQFMQVLAGNPDFTIISYETKNPLKTFLII